MKLNEDVYGCGFSAIRLGYLSKDFETMSTPP